MHALKKLLLYESDDDKTHLLSLLHQLNIKTDSIEYNNQNSKSSSASCTNYNNSYVPIETDNLSALYAYYQIDPQMYPPPDLQLYNTIQQSFHPSYSYLQSSRLQKSSFSEQQGNSNPNSSRRSRVWRRKQKRLQSPKNKKKNNRRPETNNFHQRNMIAVRRISCHDIIDPQTIMKKRFEYEQNNVQNEKRKNEWNKKIRSTNLVENKSQKYKTFSTKFNSSPPHVERHTLPIQSIMSKILDSPSTTNSSKKTLTTSVSNTLFQQQQLEKKMSNSISMIGLKVTSLRDSSTSSLASTQLLAADYNQTKPNVTIITTAIPGSQIDFGILADNAPHLSTTASSIVPHISSTLAPQIPLHVSSSTAVTSSVPKTESIVAPTSTNENIKNLVDQFKTCIATLSLLIQNKIEHEKHVISNVKSYSDKKRSRTKTKQLQSLSSSSPSLISTPNHLRLSKKTISNEHDLAFEDITVRRCNSFNDQERTSMIDLFE